MAQVFTRRDFKLQSWKNGGGSTLELFRLPHPVDPSRFLCRLSVATVSSDGPFSLFPGIDRHLLLLSGKGMHLSFDDRQVVLDKTYDIIQFEGENPIQCRLLGDDSTDFNVMVDRSWGKAQVSVVCLKENESHLIEGGDFTFLYDGISLTLIKNESLDYIPKADEHLIIINLTTGRP